MRNLFGEEIRSVSKRKGGSRKKREPKGVGCEHCPLNRIHGLRKVLGLKRINCRKAMLWAQSPGARENEIGRELVGRSGEFLWRQAHKFDLYREDFDIQNVVRCRPLDPDGANEHPVTKEELHCCSIFNDQAREKNQGKAVVHLILGKPAGTQLLGRRYSKKTPVVWHDGWDAYVITADHPSYLLRLGGEKGAGWAYWSFLDRLKAVKTILKYPGRWGYVKAQDYKGVFTISEMEELKKRIYQEVKEGRRVSVDIEDGTVDGKKVILMVGFGWGKPGPKKSYKGAARSVVLWHPQNIQSKKTIQKLEAMVQEILEDPKVRKIFQHGSYDVQQLKAMSGVRVRGYDYDSQYATYLRHPHLRTYSLESQVGFFFQEFADYKQMVAPYSGNFADAPLDVLIPYNCADADLTKRIEVRIGDSISYPLLQVYINAAFVLEDMETRGPILDLEAHTKVQAVVPSYIGKLHRQICRLADKPDFNPNTPQQVAWLLFDKLRLPELNGRSTGKEVLETLGIQTRSKAPQLILDYRRLTKMESTYLKGYKRSAELNNGMLKTIWWLTGAVTGRLRSGRGDQAEKEGIINLQNLHGSTLLQNMLVSDPNWREALAA